MVSEAVIVAGISLAGTLLGTFGGIMASNRLTVYRIEQLEKKVEKHNNIVERVFRLEDNDKLLEQRIETLEAKEA
jgi:RecA/RadA recombinase